MYLPVLIICCIWHWHSVSTDEQIRFMQPFDSDDQHSGVAQHDSTGITLLKSLLHKPQISKQVATEYLKEFGYYKNAQNFTEALRLFQKFVELPVTGELDTATQDKMRQPRCGNRDIEDEYDELSNPLDDQANGKNHSRQKRYVIEGSYWGVKDITYKISQYPRSKPAVQMNNDQVDAIIKRAFEVWQESSPLRFVKKDNDSVVNIDIKFASLSHGDGEPFDGKGQILAHAFFPRYGGDVHFDDDEQWQSLQPKDPSVPQYYDGQYGRDTRYFNDALHRADQNDAENHRHHQVVIPFRTRSAIDLYSVAAHEIGHSLGLKHSQKHNALMAPFYQGYTGDRITLKTDDIEGLQHLYGKPNKNSETFDTAIKPEKLALLDTADTTNICDDARVDAITVLGNGTTFAFRGGLYWMLNDLSYDKGYPKNITEHWDGLPEGLDAAVTDYDGDTYFFKNDKYWLYDPDGRRYKGYPRQISIGLVDTPNDLSAALIWNYDQKPYFFKGTQFWQYSRWGMPNTWPRSTREIFTDDTWSAESPPEIMAALKWTNQKSYIFTGNVYYRLDSKRLKVAPGYPRDIGEWWFGCESRAPSRSKRHVIDYSQK